MFITRKIGKILRGKANRTQVVLACVLGAMGGFTPGFAQAPALGIGLLFLFLVLNANLAVFLAAAAGAKALALAVVPLSVHVGAWLLEGPARGFLRVLADAPVFAWCGLEYYATTGGLALGLVVGLIGGVLLAFLLGRIRRKLASLEEGSEKFRLYTSKWYVKLLLFVFLGGGKGRKRTWAEIVEEERKGKPIRISGIAAVLVLGLGLFLGERFFGDRLLTEPLRAGLERLNGATVDLEALGLRITGGAVRLSGLALADSRRLDRNSLSARIMEASLDMKSLLERSFVVDRIVSREATAWEKREELARRVAREAVEAPAPETPPAGSKGLEEYLEEAAAWKERFSQAQELLGRLAGSGERPEQVEERLAREQELLALRWRKTRGLREPRPAVLIRQILLQGVAAESLGWVRLDIEARNLSSHPHRVADPARFSVRSQDGAFVLELAIAGSGQGRVEVELAYRGIPVDRIAGRLKTGGGPVLRGGVLDLEAKGVLSAEAGKGWRIDLPLTITLKNCVLTLPGLSATEVESLALPIGVRGALASPGIFFDQHVLADALITAGRKELADQVRKRAGALLGDKLPGVGEALGGIVEKAGSPEEALEAARKLAEEEARKRLEEEKQKALDAARKKLEEERQKALEEARKKAEEEKQKALEALKRKLPGIPGLPGGQKKEGGK